MEKDKNIIEELTEIYKEHGMVTPTLVLEKARDPNSSMHSRFEWDTDKAAFEYQLWQARKLIRVYPIMICGEENELIHVSVLNGKEGTGEGQYQPISFVAENETWFSFAAKELMGKLSAISKSIKRIESAANKRNKKTVKVIGSKIEEARNLSEKLDLDDE